MKKNCTIKTAPSPIKQSHKLKLCCFYCGKNSLETLIHTEQNISFTINLVELRSPNICPETGTTYKIRVRLKKKKKTHFNQTNWTAIYKSLPWATHLSQHEHHCQTLISQLSQHQIQPAIKQQT